MQRVELFWDVGSPYTYLAVTQLDSLRQRTGVEVTLRPLLLGGLFKTVGAIPPANVPNKARFLMADLARWARQLDVPIVLPPNLPFPINSLLPMRVAVAVQREHGEHQEAFCRALFDSYWARGEDVSEPKKLDEVLQQVGLDGPALRDAAASQPVKDALKEATQEAADRGAFGVPAFFVGDQLFWGNDRIEQLVLFLRNEL